MVLSFCHMTLNLAITLLDTITVYIFIWIDRVLVFSSKNYYSRCVVSEGLVWRTLRGRCSPRRLGSITVYIFIRIDRFLVFGNKNYSSRRVDTKNIFIFFENCSRITWKWWNMSKWVSKMNSAPQNPLYP